MHTYEEIKTRLCQQPKTWLVTGAAGFIGSNLVEQLLRLEQHVVGLDNFATGHQRNLDDIRAVLPAEQWKRFRFIRGDTRNLDDCRSACREVDYVLHQAALGSVPRSLKDPLQSHTCNVDGILNMLLAARDGGIKRFIYASSSSVYGDDPALPKLESRVGRPLSPYAATKLICEIYANVFERSYGIPVVGLRYFNVFGPRQDPAGAYAAVIPRWFAAILRGDEILINGDGKTSRDFCFVANVVQANILAATSSVSGAIFNISCGGRTTLVELYERIKASLQATGPFRPHSSVAFQPERGGDIKHSMADIELARTHLGYMPSHPIELGLRESAQWYRSQRSSASPSASAQAT